MIDREALGGVLRLASVTSAMRRPPGRLASVTGLTGRLGSVTGLIGRLGSSTGLGLSGRTGSVTIGRSGSVTSGGVPLGGPSAAQVAVGADEAPDQSGFASMTGATGSAATYRSSAQRSSSSFTLFGGLLHSGSVAGGASRVTPFVGGQNRQHHPPRHAPSSPLSDSSHTSPVSSILGTQALPSSMRLPPGLNRAAGFGFGGEGQGSGGSDDMRAEVNASQAAALAAEVEGAAELAAVEQRLVQLLGVTKAEKRRARKQASMLALGAAGFGGSGWQGGAATGGMGASLPLGGPASDSKIRRLSLLAPHHGGAPVMGYGTGHSSAHWQQPSASGALGTSGALPGSGRVSGLTAGPPPVHPFMRPSITTLRPGLSSGLAGVPEDGASAPLLQSRASVQLPPTGQVAGRHPLHRFPSMDMLQAGYATEPGYHTGLNQDPGGSGAQQQAGHSRAFVHLPAGLSASKGPQFGGDSSAHLEDLLKGEQGNGMAQGAHSVHAAWRTPPGTAQLKSRPPLLAGRISPGAGAAGGGEEGGGRRGRFRRMSATVSNALAFLRGTPSFRRRTPAQLARVADEEEDMSGDLVRPVSFTGQDSSRSRSGHGHPGAGGRTGTQASGSEDGGAVEQSGGRQLMAAWGVPGGQPAQLQNLQDFAGTQAVRGQAESATSGEVAAASPATRSSAHLSGNSAEEAPSSPQSGPQPSNPDAAAPQRSPPVVRTSLPAAAGGTPAAAVTAGGGSGRCLLASGSGRQGGRSGSLPRRATAGSGSYSAVSGSDVLSKENSTLDPFTFAFPDPRALAAATAAGRAGHGSFASRSTPPPTNTDATHSDATLPQLYALALTSLPGSAVEDEGVGVEGPGLEDEGPGDDLQAGVHPRTQSCPMVGTGSQQQSLRRSAFRNSPHTGPGSGGEGAGPAEIPAVRGVRALTVGAAESAGSPSMFAVIAGRARPPSLRATPSRVQLNSSARSLMDGAATAVTSRVPSAVSSRTASHTSLGAPPGLTAPTATSVGGWVAPEAYCRHAPHQQYSPEELGVMQGQYEARRRQYVLMVEVVAALVGQAEGELRVLKVCECLSKLL